MYKRVRMTYSWKDFVYRASWLWQCGNNRWMLWNRTGRSCWKSWAPQSCIQDSWKEQGGLQAVQTKSAEVSDTGHRGGREGGMGAGLAPSRFSRFLLWKCRLKAACDRLGCARGMAKFGNERWDCLVTFGGGISGLVECWVLEQQHLWESLMLCRHRERVRAVRDISTCIKA